MNAANVLLLLQFAGMVEDIKVQQLLSRCSHPSALVVLVPPFDEQLPQDDGVRLVTSAVKLMESFQAVLKQVTIPYRVLSASVLEERVTEVSQMAGWSHHGMSSR
jgi:hypothetical protein